MDKLTEQSKQAELKLKHEAAAELKRKHKAARLLEEIERTVEIKDNYAVLKYMDDLCWTWILGWLHNS